MIHRPSPSVPDIDTIKKTMVKMMVRGSMPKSTQKTSLRALMHYLRDGGDPYLTVPMNHLFKKKHAGIPHVAAQRMSLELLQDFINHHGDLTASSMVGFLEHLPFKDMPNHEFSEFMQVARKHHVLSTFDEAYDGYFSEFFLQCTLSAPVDNADSTWEVKLPHVFEGRDISAHERLRIATKMSSTPISCEENYLFFDPLLRLGIDPFARLDFDMRHTAIPHDRASPACELLFSQHLSSQHNDIWRPYLHHFVFTPRKKSKFHLLVKKARELDAIENLTARCASYAVETGDDYFLAQCLAPID